MKHFHLLTGFELKCLLDISGSGTVVAVKARHRKVMLEAGKKSVDLLSLDADANEGITCHQVSFSWGPDPWDVHVGYPYTDSLCSQNKVCRTLHRMRRVHPVSFPLGCSVAIITSYSLKRGTS